MTKIIKMQDVLKGNGQDIVQPTQENDAKLRKPVIEPEQNVPNISTRTNEKSKPKKKQSRKKRKGPQSIQVASSVHKSRKRRLKRNGLVYVSAEKHKHWKRMDETDLDDLLEWISERHMVYLMECPQEAYQVEFAKCFVRFYIIPKSGTAEKKIRKPVDEGEEHPEIIRPFIRGQV